MTRTALAALSLTVNGELRRAPAGTTVRGLVDLLQLGGRRVAVAVNRDVVPRSEHGLRILEDGDRVEILEAVGGG